MSNKSEYALFCTKTYIPIFSQPWWMDAVCGEENWDVWLYYSGGDVLAALPYYRTQRDNLRLITKAPLTQNNGLIIRYPAKQKYCSKVDYEEKIMNAAISFIENLGIDRYEQQFHYSFTNILPFLWSGYRAAPRYTYVIEDTADLDSIKESFAAKIRNQIRAAHKLVHVETTLSPAEFYRVNALTFSRQGKPIPYSYDQFLTLHEACQMNGCGQMLFAVDNHCITHSVAYIVWDEHSTYYLLNGTDPLYKNSQANALLIEQSIAIASRMGKSFDFEGSMIRSVEQAFRQYGGHQKLYFRIYKTLNPELPEVSY